MVADDSRDQPTRHTVPATAPTYVPSAERTPPSGAQFRGPLESVLRHPLLTIIPLLLLTGVGVALALSRPPTYKAEARVSVGRVDVPAYTLQGVVIGNQTLATGYARAITAEPVVTVAARRAAVSLDHARNDLAASPIPDSTLIRIEATGHSADTARRLTNGGAAGLISYVAALNQRQQSTGVLSQYRSAQARTDRLRSRLVALVAKLADARAIAATRLDLATAQLQSQTLSAQYQNSAGASATQNNLQLIVPAVTAKSDRLSVLERLGLIGLIAGLVLGVGLSLFRANRGLLGPGAR